MKYIELTKGFFAVVDDEDYHWLSKYSWCWNNKYAMTHIDGKGVYMHRLIMDVSGYENKIDHINGSKLDNRRCNLRLANATLNQGNVDKLIKVNTTSIYKGIAKNRYGRYRVKVSGKHVGTFFCEVAASNAYNYYAKIVFGEFAKINDIPYMSKENWMKQLSGNIGKDFVNYE